MLVWMGSIHFEHNSHTQVSNLGQLSQILPIEPVSLFISILTVECYTWP